MTTETVNPDLLVVRVADGDEDYAAELRAFIRRVHSRGDTVVAYRNEDLGHPDLGSYATLSHGSAAAQLEATQYPEPPTTLPDIGGLIGWRYQLALICPPPTVLPTHHRI